MGLGLGIYATPHGEQLLDCLPFLRSAELSTGPHGFAEAALDLRLSLADAFRLYDRPGFPYVLACWNGRTVWEGRLEDPDLSFSRSDGGLVARAFGAWRALSDVPYTALWSKMDYSDWETVARDATFTYVQPERFEIHFGTDQIFIALRKGEKFDNTHYATLRLRIPSGSDRNFVAVSFDYDFFGDATYRAEFTTGGTFVWTLNGNGASQTGSVDTTFTGDSVVYINLFYNSGAAATYSGETGDRYLKITNLRVKTTTSASVYADEIARALVAFVNGINSAQLSSATVLVESPALDLTDELYEDLTPAEILTRLAGYGDNQTPPRQWETGVWEDRRLHFRPKGSAGKAWYVDVGGLKLSRSAGQLRNSAYGVYRDAIGRTARTAAVADADSVSRWAVTRRAPVGASTTSATEAAVHRDAFVADWKDPRPQAEFAFDALYDQYGNRWPLWMCRAGDTLTVRNLRATLATSVDRIRTFRASETRWRGVRGQGQALAVTPEEPLPGLDVLIARQAKGF